MWLGGIAVAVASSAQAQVWDPAPAWQSSDQIYSFATRGGDLNGDGKLDVVEADYYGKLRIYYHEGAQLPAAPSWVSSEERSFEVDLADVNGDGALDILSGNSYLPGVRVFLNQNTANDADRFHPYPDLVLDGAATRFCYRIKATDIDNDGDIDILGLCYSPGGLRLRLLLNDNGTLAQAAVWVSPMSFAWWPEVDVADYDGDGSNEVAVSNGFDGVDYRTYVLGYNAALHGLDVEWISPVPSGGGSGSVATTHAYWLDYEVDGDLDLVTSKGEVYLNENGTLSNTRLMFATFYGGGQYAMEVGDYNRDGRTDAVISTHPGNSWGPDSIAYYENTPAGLVLKQSFQVPALVVEMHNVDYNSDGSPELLLATFGQALIYRLANTVVDTDQDGVPDNVDNCPYAANPAQEDLDGDGDGDLCDDDDDGDGILDVADNCPTVSNPGQEDGDFDGIGDVCDPVFNQDAALNELTNTVLELARGIDEASPPGGSGLKAKLTGEGGVLAKVEQAVTDYLSGSTSAAEFQAALDDALTVLAAFENQLNAKIENGQITAQDGAELLQLASKVRLIILAMYAAAY